MTSFLDKIGLQRLWDAISSLFATKTEVAARTTARIYYGTCSTTASYVAKVATTETFPTVAYDDNGTTKYKPESGTVVGIKYTVSNTYKTAGSTHTLEVNSTGAWPMYYNNAELATTTSANTLVAGYKNRYVFYMFNGTQWVFLSAGYDANSTYSDMTQAEITAGTGTTGRKITPKMLRDNFYTEDEVNTLLGNKANSNDLATVATSGSYNDLDDTPTDVSSFNNDAGYISGFTETDPTVPAWAKQSTKPTYTAQEVGALPSSTTIPTKVSDLTNDSGFTTNTGTITGITMNGASKGTSGVVNLGTVITSETALSKGTTSGSGNAVTDISVSGHQITLTKGSTFLTSHQDISGKADKSEMSVVAGTGANADKTTITLKSGTSATVLTSHQDISGKADVAALAGYTPTANFATINGASITGGGDVIITAGGSSITTIDAVPTKNSTNPVQSGGVYDAIEGGFYY